MPRYKVGVARKPTAPTTSTSIDAKTANEALQKAMQSSSITNEYVVLSAQPIRFEVKLARKPSRPDRYIQINASGINDARLSAERQDSHIIAVEVFELKDTRL